MSAIGRGCRVVERCFTEEPGLEFSSAIFLLYKEHDPERKCRGTYYT